MAITVYSGRPRSGKSYSVVENVIIPCLQRGRLVVTNLPLKLEPIYEDFPEANVMIIDRDDISRGILDLEDRTDLRGAVFIIDECWKYWPNGRRDTEFPEHQRSFFAEHGHFVGAAGFTTEVVLVCQSLQQIAPFVRELVDATYITSKLDKIGRKDQYRVNIYSGPQTLTRPDREQEVRSGFGTYKPEVYRYYVSHTRNDTGFDAGIEMTEDKRGSLWSSPMFRIAIPIGLAIGVFGIWSMLNWLNPSRFRDGETAPAVAAAPAPAPSRSAFGAIPVARPSPAAGGPALSETWRIAAILHGEDTRIGWAILTTADGISRTIPLAGHCSTVPRTRWEWVCIVDGESVTYHSGAREARNTLI